MKIRKIHQSLQRHEISWQLAVHVRRLLQRLCLFQEPHLVKSSFTYCASCLSVSSLFFQASLAKFATKLTGSPSEIPKLTGSPSDDPIRRSATCWIHFSCISNLSVSWMIHVGLWRRIQHWWWGWCCWCCGETQKTWNRANFRFSCCWNEGKIVKTGGQMEVQVLRSSAFLSVWWWRKSYAVWDLQCTRQFC